MLDGQKIMLLVDFQRPPHKLGLLAAGRVGENPRAAGQPTTFRSAGDDGDAGMRSPPPRG